MLLLVFLSGLGFACFYESSSTLIRLKILGVLDLAKPGQKCLLFVVPTAACLCLYMLILRKDGAGDN